MKQQIPFDITEVGYLRLYRKSSTYNVIELHSDLSGGKYGGIAQTYIKRTNYKYFKVSQIAYPIYDVRRNSFLKRNVWYPVLDNEIQLYFPTITFANPAALTNVIYADNATGLVSSEQLIKLYVTVANSPFVIVEPGQQYVNLYSSWSGAAMDAAMFLSGFDNLAINAFIDGSTNAQITVYKNIVIYDPATRSFLQDGGQPFVYAFDDTAGKYKYVNVNKTNGVIVSPVKFTDSLGLPYYQVPMENIRVTGAPATISAGGISINIIE